MDGRPNRTNKTGLKKVKKKKSIIIYETLLYWLIKFSVPSFKRKGEISQDNLYFELEIEWVHMLIIER